MNIFILTEGGKEYGFGHVARCSSIFQAFVHKGFTPKFFINGDNSIKTILKDIPFEFADWMGDFSFLNSDDIVIVDSYLASEDTYRKISKKISLLVCLDDNKRITYPGGIIVNGLIDADSLNYPKKDNTTYLLGSKYTPLRSDFWSFEEYKINESIKNILITMGGNDLRNLTPKILKLLNISFPNVIKKVIVSDSFNNTRDIEVLKNSNVEIIYAPDSKKVLECMLNADLAISAGGQTLYELACVGVPTVAVGIIENQKNNIENWEKTGFIEYAGFWSDENLLNNIQGKINLLKKSDLRSKKHSIGNKSIDGVGSLRIVKKILNKYYINNSIFREVNRSDCFKIFELANDDDVRRSSFNSEKINLKNHKVWFENILKDDTTKFFILEYGNDLIGQIRFDVGEKYHVISISLNKKYRGLGLSKYLLTKAIEQLRDVDKIVAYVKKDNDVSIRFFENMGFMKDCEVIVKNCGAIKFFKEL